MEEPSNHQLGSDSDNDENFPDSVSRAFRIDMVRDIILDYVIHDRNQVLISNVRSCRLVNKSFHQSVTRILLDCREPLFRFHLTRNNCTIDTPCEYRQRDTTLVEEFSKFAISSQGLYQRVPSFSMKVTDRRDSNIEQNLFALLTNFACGLVELVIPFSGYRSPTPLIANVSFPKLRVLKTSDYDVGDQDNYVQSLLNVSENLQSFSLKYFDELARSQNFLLPSSIAVVDLDCALERYNDKLIGLAKHSLPNLRELKLRILYSLPWTDPGAVITDILKNVQNSLQKFSIKVGRFHHYGLHRESATFKLPLMEKLESLQIDAKYLELEGEPSSLEHHVPMLTHMALTRHKISMFEKWTKKSYFKNVTSLAVGVHADENEERNNGDDDDGNDDDDDDILRPLILGAFPNLQKLNITVGYFENAMSKLTLLLTEIKSLRHLRIGFIKPDYELESSDVCDAFIIGIPKERLPALREAPDLWNDLKLQSTTCIRNLTELKTLELYGKFPWGFSPMSQVAFDFGIFKMPKLSKLILEDAFSRVDMEHIATKWQLEEHVISAVGKKTCVRTEVFQYERYRTDTTTSSQFSIKTVLDSV